MLEQGGIKKYEKNGSSKNIAAWKNHVLVPVVETF